MASALAIALAGALFTSPSAAQGAADTSAAHGAADTSAAQGAADTSAAPAALPATESRAEREALDPALVAAPADTLFLSPFALDADSGATPLLADSTAALPSADSAVGAGRADSAGATALAAEVPRTPLPMSPADSAASAATREAAERASGLHVVVSLADLQLIVLRGRDTLRVAPVALATGWSFSFDGRSWAFRTPPGRRTVLRKDADPVWIPPDWHYAEAAHKHGLRLDSLARDSVVPLLDGRRLEVRGDEVGVVEFDGVFAPLLAEEEIVFDGTLYIPPYGTKNRRVVGELGRFRLDLGDGYLLHGTPREETIGTATTHGCVRLRDADIEWLYENVRLGTPVYIY